MNINIIDKEVRNEYNMIKAYYDYKTDNELIQILMNNLRTLYHFNRDQLLKIDRKATIKMCQDSEVMIEEIEKLLN
jgi:hypothetical protein